MGKECENVGDIGENHQKDCCSQVKTALLSGDGPDAALSAHLEHCKDCKEFKHKLDTMLCDLKALNVEALTKDGASLPEAVMEEVRRRSIFHVSQKKDRHVFRHMGLVAACIVICVMAAPTVLHILNPAKSADMAYDMTAPEANFAAVEEYSYTAYADYDDEAAIDDGFAENESLTVETPKESANNLFRFDAVLDKTDDTVSGMTETDKKQMAGMLYSANISGENSEMISENGISQQVPVTSPKPKEPEQADDRTDGIPSPDKKALGSIGGDGSSSGGGGGGSVNSVYGTEKSEPVESEECIPFDDDTIIEIAYQKAVEKYGEAHGFDKENAVYLAESDVTGTVTLTGSDGFTVSVTVVADTETGTWTVAEIEEP